MDNSSTGSAGLHTTYLINNLQVRQSRVSLVVIGRRLDSLANRVAAGSVGYSMLRILASTGEPEQSSAFFAVWIYSNSVMLKWTYHWDGIS